MPWFNMSKETAKVVEFERELVEFFKPYIDLRNQSVIDRADLRTVASKMVKNGWIKLKSNEAIIICPKPTESDRAVVEHLYEEMHGKGE